jgi:hypothetical protein
MNCSEDMLLVRHREATKNSAQTVLSVAERNQVPIFIAVSIFVVVERERKTWDRLQPGQLVAEL